MAFDIDKMKTDGVSPHLIELAELSERNDTAAFEKIAMGIENTEIFRQFISMESDAPVWDYMYAAGLCTKEEADWFKSGENPYIDAVTLTSLTSAEDGGIFYYTESRGEQKNFKDTLVIPKGTTLYFPNTGSIATRINNTDLVAGSRVPYTFNEDAAILQVPQE